MKPVMKVQVTEIGVNFQGIVEMPSFALTKLKKENGCTSYRTVSNLKQAAVAAAKKYNATLAFLVPTKKLAAKRSAR